MGFEISQIAEARALRREAEWSGMPQDEKLWTAHTVSRRQVVRAWEEIRAGAGRIIGHGCEARYGKSKVFGTLGLYPFFDSVGNRDVEELWDAMACGLYPMSKMYASYLGHREEDPAYDGRCESDIARDVASLYLGAMSGASRKDIPRFPLVGIPVVREVGWVRRLQHGTGADILVDSYFSGVPVEMIVGPEVRLASRKGWETGC